MPANTTPVFPAVVASQGVAFTSADTTTAKAIYTPTGSNGARVDALMVAWNDTVAGAFQVLLRRGGVSFLFGTVTLPPNAGALGTVPSINLLQYIAGLPVDAYGNPILELDSASQLYGGLLATMSGSKTLNIVPMAAEF